MRYYSNDISFIYRALVYEDYEEIKITQINALSDKVQTLKGLQIGDSIEQLKYLYGEYFDIVEENTYGYIYRYEPHPGEIPFLNVDTILFIHNNEKITSIEILHETIIGDQVY